MEDWELGSSLVEKGVDKFSALFFGQGLSADAWHVIRASGRGEAVP